ncbi:MAG: hypothetical protein MUE80_07335, partial [Acidobacteria bacterium]|nr:hypothetical protein [Acidobacteriota bacterium]
TPAHDDWLKTRFDLQEYRIITDFNRAARFVRGLAEGRPDYRRLILPGTLEGTFHLPVKAGWYNKVLMSLVLSYIFDPLETLKEVRRVIMPGGLLVLSSMRPDTDASGPFTRLLQKIEATPEEALPPERPKALLIESLRVFLNDAQELVDLEEAGTFDFFDPEKLEGLLEETGWDILRFQPSYGTPPQGYVYVAKARDTNGKLLRLTVMAAVGAILLVLNRIKTSHGVMNLALALALVDAAGIAIMIFFLGGFLTSYYQGLNIIVMGMIVLIPLAFRYTIYLYVSVWLMYAVPSVLRYFFGPKAQGIAEMLKAMGGTEVQVWRFIINNLTFLSSIIVVGAIGSSYMESIRRRELRSRLQLEETTAQLKESNEKLKSLDELKTQFFANVNHELRTPLTLMLAPMKSLLEGRMGKLSPSSSRWAGCGSRSGRSTWSSSCRPCWPRSSRWPTRGSSGSTSSTRPTRSS